MPSEQAAVRGNKRRGKRQLDEAELALERKAAREKTLANWVPKTTVGKLVRNGEIGAIEQLLERNLPIMEPEVVDTLLPDADERLVDLSRTTKVRASGRAYSYRASILVGDKNAYIGIGTGKDKERFPAVKKAAKNAKLNLVKVHKGCGSWECGCGTAHSVPFKVVGKAGSVRVMLLPAPKGTGLVVGDNIKDVMTFAGIKDVWCKTFGSTDTKLNFVRAAIDALTQTTRMHVSNDIKKAVGEK